MYTVRVTITNIQTERFRVASAQDFWAGFQVERGIELATSEYEARLVNKFPRRLTELVQAHILGRPSRFLDAVPASRDEQTSRLISRVIFTLEGVAYGSLKMDIGIPDIDSFLELIGNNEDVLEAILGAYIPEAFEFAVGGGNVDGRFVFNSDLSPELVEKLRELKQKQSQSTPATALAKGQWIASSLMKSAILLPVLLIIFIWHFARQDIAADRQILSSMIQTMVQQQTATLSLLKDALIRTTKEPEPKVSPNSTSKP